MPPYNTPPQHRDMCTTAQQSPAQHKKAQHSTATQNCTPQTAEQTYSPRTAARTILRAIPSPSLSGCSARPRPPTNPPHTPPPLHASRPHPTNGLTRIPALSPKVQRARAARALQRPTPHVSPRGESGLGAAARAWLGHACAPKKIKEATHAPHPWTTPPPAPVAMSEGPSVGLRLIEHALPCETTKDTEPGAQAPPSERGIDSSVASRA